MTKGRRGRPRVAVLGGGFQGCCIALALAERGAAVTLFDRNASLLGRAFSAAEGKLHLGYVYAGDRSLATARMMKQGALSFAPLLERFLERRPEFNLSSPFDYIVHRDSQVSPDAFGAYLSTVHAMLTEDGAARSGAYCGIDLESPAPLQPGDMDTSYSRDCAIAGFRTAEIAIDTRHLAETVRQRIDDDPAIEQRLGSIVTGVHEGATGLSVESDRGGVTAREPFDHVVNALWDGRLAIEAGRGTLPDRPWLHRFKYGMRFRLRRADVRLPSMTAVLGPFGDIVAYRDGTYYASWYPAGMRWISSDVVPPDWPARPEPALESEIARASLAGLASVVPALGSLDPSDLVDLEVRGGVIVAWGRTDIDDPASGLHRRYEIGVTSAGGYHSVDPGKLTMAPHFASVCAGRIMGG